MKTLFLICLLPVILVSIAHSEELLYPAGSSFELTYTLERDRITLDDTIIVNRSIANNDYISLTGLYLSDNIPTAFSLIDVSFRLNSTPLTQVDTIRILDLIYPGYVNYVWVLNADGNLSPGDSLHVSYKLIPTELGDYYLPLHTSVFEAGGGQYYAYSDSTPISVVLVLDTNDTDPLLPIKYLTSKAYPNPFNNRVRIDYESDRIGSAEVEFEIYDVLGRKIINKKLVAENGKNTVYWTTGTGQSTGLYFYRITAGDQTTDGKIILLK